MKTGIFGQQLSVMESLKAETFAAHARFQTAPYFSALAACQLPLESYVGQLRALAIIHGALEQALSETSDPRVASVWRPEMKKLPLLMQDLRYFEPRSVADLKESVDAALSLAASIRVMSAEQPIAMLGCLYVLEGSTLGASVVRPLVARAFLLAGEDGMAHLHNYGATVHERWRDFKEQMNALRAEASEYDLINSTAVAFFEQIGKIVHALYPFKPESKAFLVTSINPEAGRHAVPADPRELEAAVRAGDMCWQRYPYFEQRYGERGLRYARSDAAWQATLYQFSPEQIRQQVQWLGRVLAGRGMPTMLLQHQLELLVQELCAVHPEKREAYETLLPAAAALGEARRRHIPDAVVAAISAEFGRAVGSEWNATFPHTGAILCCAVADEREGSPDAVDSLLPWFTDPARFPALWIAAVHAALARARG